MSKTIDMLIITLHVYYYISVKSHIVISLFGVTFSIFTLFFLAYLSLSYSCFVIPFRHDYQLLLLYFLSENSSQFFSFCVYNCQYSQCFYLFPISEVMIENYLIEILTTADIFLTMSTGLPRKRYPIWTTSRRWKAQSSMKSSN